MNRFTALLIALALIAGTAGCPAEPAPDPGPPVRYELAIVSTEGGSVTTPGEGAFTHDDGTVVSLVAIPDSGYRFANWTGHVNTIADLNAASTTITMSDDYSITANFVKQYNLTISSTTGGSVTIPGEGTFAFDEGEVAHLTAEPEDGYHFVGWAGGDAPIADVTSATTTVRMANDYAVIGGFAAALYFQTDVCATLSGPAALPPEERTPFTILQIHTNVVMGSVHVDLPDGRSVIVPAYTDAFSPGVDWVDLFRFATTESGMPIAGEEYVFTALNAAGEAIPGLIDTSVWVGVEPPDPPTNVSSELLEDGILLRWDESPTIPGSFEPRAQPQLGFYQVEIRSEETGEMVYGANCIPASPHLVPQDRADFIEGRDWGLSLAELEDGTYRLRTCVGSIAPEGSSGKGGEYFNTDPSEDVLFTVKDGEITIEQSGQ